MLGSARRMALQYWKMDPQILIKRLALQPLPGEGGYFRQSFKDEAGSNFLFGNLTKQRSFVTAIYYLVTKDQFSALHRLPQVEIFHFYLGDPVEMIQIPDSGKLVRHVLGQKLDENQELQVVTPAHTWQGTKLVKGGDWALLGTTVSPGFEFEDLELGIREKLLHSFPQHKSEILSFTR